MSDTQIPIQSWKIWKVVILALVIFGAWSTVMVFFPHYTPAAFYLGILYTILGITGCVLVHQKQTRLGHIAFGNALFLIMLTMSARSWMSIIDNIYLWGVWMVVLVGIYIFAWMLPRYNPTFSKFLFREQYTPETRVGKMILNASAKFLPIAGASGALFGMYASRDGNDNLAMLFVAIAFSLVSIALAQLTAHQFWMEDQQKAQSGEGS